ncbi:MAG: hypothetical protein HY540_07105 [Deltaproteobacteria bacterium]|nr:hypothetical protein [Deltaproteobacteria bacterium]
MKPWYGVVLVICFAGIAHAEVPKTLNLQSVVYDRDGKITTADNVNVHVKIQDEQGQVVFEEDHLDTPVVSGAINLYVGEAQGGIPLEALDPSVGRKFIDVTIDGSNSFDLLPLNAVPYAVWSQKALEVADKSVGSEQIKDGAIELRHLGSQLQFDQLGGAAQDTQIPNTIARKADLDAHVRASANAHSASAIALTAGRPFASQLGGTVQLALETVYSQIATEIANRRSAIAATNTSILTLQGTVNNHGGRLGVLEPLVNVHTTDLAGIHNQIDGAGNPSNLQNQINNANARIDEQGRRINRIMPVDLTGQVDLGPMNEVRQSRTDSVVMDFRDLGPGDSNFTCDQFPPYVVNAWLELDAMNTNITCGDCGVTWTVKQRVRVVGSRICELVLNYTTQVNTTGFDMAIMHWRLTYLR